MMDDFWIGFWFGTINAAFMILVAIPWAIRKGRGEDP